MPKLLEIEGSHVAWAAVVSVILAVLGGVYSYGQLSQRVYTLEELKPLQVAAALAEIKANQTRTITDLGRVQADLSELRRALGVERRWDRIDVPPHP